MNNINHVIQSLIDAKNAGKNPQMILQALMQRNPNYQQLATTLQNMSNGQDPQQFVMQLARQNGVDPQNLQALQQFFRQR